MIFMERTVMSETQEIEEVSYFGSRSGLTIEQINRLLTDELRGRTSMSMAHKNMLHADRDELKSELNITN